MERFTCVSMYRAAMNDGNYIVFVCYEFHAVLNCKIELNKQHSASITMWQTYLSHLVASVTRIYFAKFRHTFLYNIKRK